MSKLLLLSLSAISFAGATLFLKSTARAQFGGGAPAFVQLQATTPGTVQTGNANIAGKIIAGAVEVGALKLNGGSFVGAVLKSSDAFGNVAWAVDGLALPFTGSSSAPGAILFIQNSSNSVNAAAAAFVNAGGPGKGIAATANFGTGAIAGYFQATGTGGIGVRSEAKLSGGSFLTTDALSIAVDATGGSFGGVFIARNDSSTGIKGIGQGNQSSNGVWGDTLGNGSGVLGTSFSGYGVKAVSLTSDGVFGQADTLTKAGIHGTSLAGYGIYGQAYNTGSIAVYATNQQGIGVKGESQGNSGVVGSSELHEGVVGTSQTSYGIKGSSQTGIGVSGESEFESGVMGISSRNYGVRGVSINSIGVSGKSTVLAGVQGDSESMEGVIGITDGPSFGVRGEASLGTGVKGFGGVTGVLGEGGLNGVGVHAKGGVTGLLAESTQLHAIRASASNSATGVEITADTGVGMKLTSNGDGAQVKINSPMGQGLNVQTNGGNALIATSQSSICISGASVSNWGVSGHSDTGIGVFANSRDYEGLWGTSDNGVGIRGRGKTIGVVGEGTNDFGIYGFSSHNFAGYFAGNLMVTGSISKAGGTFTIDHPLDPFNRYLQHSFVESPDMMNIYNGVVKTDARGYARVTMPSWFQALNRDFRYQLTVLDEGDSPTFALAKVVKKIKDNVFMIRTSVPNTEVSWTVTGIRQDPYANAHRVEVEPYKSTKDRGFLLHPKEYGESNEKSIDERLRRELFR